MNTNPHQIKRPNEKSPFGRDGAKNNEKKPFFTKGMLANAFGIVAVSAAAILYSTNTINHDITPESFEPEITVLDQSENNIVTSKSAKPKQPEETIIAAAPQDTEEPKQKIIITAPSFNNQNGGRGGATPNGQHNIQTTKSNSRGGRGRGGASGTGSCNSCDTSVSRPPEPPKYEESVADTHRKYENIDDRSSDYKTKTRVLKVKARKL